jgi:uncharacterized protein YegP (UPF0339 family)
MATSNSNPLIDSYTNRIGTPSTADEVYGYWLFVLGLVLGVLGIVLVAVADPETTLRGLGLGVAAVGLLLLLIGPIMRMPLRQVGQRISYFGGALGVVATLWFLIAFFSGNWSTTFENSEPIIVGIYGLGILTMAVGSVAVPLATDKREEDEGPMQVQQEADGTDYEAALEEAEQQLEETEQQLEAAQKRAQQAEQRAEKLASGERSRKQILREELNEIEDSQSQFELYTDSSGNHRWRLRHRDRGVVAASGRGYVTREQARKALSATRRDTFGGTVVDLDSIEGVDVSAADEGVDGADAPAFFPDVESQATFRTYSDGDGKHRWQLSHENGETIADSVQGYSSENARNNTIEYVRSYVQVADYLPIDPAAFELCRDGKGNHRWRLLHRNGKVLTSATKRHDTRQEARAAIDEFSEKIAATERTATQVFQDKPDQAQIREAVSKSDAPVIGLIYQDSPNEWRLLLSYSNGRVIGESGDWYVSRSNAREALERAIDSAPKAEVLDIGTAAFEIYEDNSGTWRWRLRHRSGRVMAGCNNGYSSQAAAAAAITSVKRNAPGADVGALKR